jgi:hypothetical protein
MQNINAQPGKNAPANAKRKTQTARRRKNAGAGRFEMAELEKRILWSASAIRPVLESFTGFNAYGADLAPAEHLVSASFPKVGNGATALTATVAPNNNYQLNWKGDGIASGYMIMVSINGSGYIGIGITSATNYLVTGLTVGPRYIFEVQAYGRNEVSNPSNAAAVSYPTPATPAGFAVAVTGSVVSLSWSPAANATGYNVLRSSDGVTFTQLAHLALTSTVSYLDPTVVSGHTYYYEVKAFNLSGTSAPTKVTSVFVPAAPITNGVTITTRFGDELVITANGADDSISVAEAGSTLDITADGQTFTDTVPLAGLFIYTRGGKDSISIANSVTAEATLETIDGAATAITCAGTDVNAWIDSTDVYSGTGDVHRVSSFAGGVSKAQGASLVDPSDAGTVKNVNLSLFGTGPVIGDVNQGSVGDCYFMASLAAFADVKPSVLVDSAVDMGDGTYVVQFMNGNTPTYVRVNNAFSTGGFSGGFQYAFPGSNDTIWAAVFEKAFCYFRTGANTYASISGGWMSEVFSDLGVNNNSFAPSSYNASTFYTMVSTDLASGDAVTLATPNSPPNLVGDHAYGLLSASMVNGVPMFVVRNPWGVSGDSLENGQGQATLTFAQLAANFEDGTQAV